MIQRVVSGRRHLCNTIRCHPRHLSWLLQSAYGGLRMGEEEKPDISELVKQISELTKATKEAFNVVNEKIGS